jgi:hypothetical protein
MGKSKREKYRHSKRSKHSKEDKPKRKANLGTIKLPSRKTFKSTPGDSTRQATQPAGNVPFTPLEREILITEYLRNRQVMMRKGMLPKTSYLHSIFVNLIPDFN